MAHLMRGLAIVGLIAVNSPVHQQRPDGAPERPAALPHLPGALPRLPAALDAGPALHGIALAREAAGVLAGLDKTTRERLLAGLAATTAGTRPAAGLPARAAPSPR